MGDLNLNVDMSNLMPVPFEGASSTASTTSTANSQGILPGTNDTLTTSTSSANKTSTVNLESGDPIPEAPKKQGMETLMQLGASSATTGPGGPGGLANPWFKANPTVAFALAYLDFFAALRENKSAMGEMLVQQVGITMDLAKSAADLVTASAQKESEQHIVDAIVAGIQMGVSIAGAVISAVAAYKAANPSKEMVDADTDIKNIKKSDAYKNDAKQLDADYQLEQTKLQQNNAAMGKVDKGEGVVGTDGKAVTADGLKQSGKDIQAKMDKIQNDIKEKKVADQKLEEAQTRFKDAEGKHLGTIDRLNSVSQPVIQALNKAADMTGSILKADISIKKGAINAEQQILQGQQEIIKRLNDTISQSYANTTDAMNQLIQSLKKMEDELVRAMSMTRN